MRAYFEGVCIDYVDKANPVTGGGDVRHWKPKTLSRIPKVQVTLSKSIQWWKTFNTFSLGVFHQPSLSELMKMLSTGIPPSKRSLLKRYDASSCHWRHDTPKKSFFTRHCGMQHHEATRYISHVEWKWARRFFRSLHRWLTHNPSDWWSNYNSLNSPTCDGIWSAGRGHVRPFENFKDKRKQDKTRKLTRYSVTWILVWIGLKMRSRPPRAKSFLSTMSQDRYSNSDDIKGFFPLIALRS